MINDEDRRSEDNNWQLRADKLRSRWNVPELDHLINGFKKESKNDTRLLARQLKSIYELFDEYDPPYDFLSPFVTECCRRYRYRFTQLKELFDEQWKNWTPELFSASEISVPRIEPYVTVADRDMMSYATVADRDMMSYANAFKERCQG